MHFEMIDMPEFLVVVDEAVIQETFAFLERTADGDTAAARAVNYLLQVCRHRSGFRCQLLFSSVFSGQHLDDSAVSY